MEMQHMESRDRPGSADLPEPTAPRRAVDSFYCIFCQNVSFSARNNNETATHVATVLPKIDVLETPVETANHFSVWIESCGTEYQISADIPEKLLKRLCGLVWLSNQ